MKTICFFCSYYTGNTMPAYVRYYLEEVRRHFTEVVMVTNEKEMIPDDIAFLKQQEITLRLVANEGYDFGMWYKMLAAYDVTQYDRVGLINDSCILFKKLDFVFKWIEEEKADYYGLTDSYSISYHIQSCFVVVNKKAIPHVVNYFNQNGIIEDFWGIVNVYEVGLCTYLINAGLIIKACYPIKKGKRENPLWMGIKPLIKKGFPLIKKKIIMREYRYANWNALVMWGFDPFPNHYVRLIKKVTGTSFPAAIFFGLITRKDAWYEFKFNVRYVVLMLFGFSWRAMWRTYSSIKKLFKSGDKN